MLAVMVSNEMVKTSRRLMTMAGISSGSVTSRKVCGQFAERQRGLLIDPLDADEAGLHHQHDIGTASRIWPSTRTRSERGCWAKRMSSRRPTRARFPAPAPAR